MTAEKYEIVTAHRASNLIYEIARQARQGVWVVPDNVCPAVPLALACAGADLHFVDIDAASLCLDTGKVAELIRTENVAGVVYVRTYGADIPAKNDLQNLRNALPNAILIDDRCIGVPLMHPPENGDADVVLFSTGYGKVLDLDGGAYGVFKSNMDFKSGGQTLAPKAFENLLALASVGIKKGNPAFADFDFAVPEFSTKQNPPSQDWSGLTQSIISQLPDRLAHKAELNTIYAQGLTQFSPLFDDYQNWRFHVFVQNAEQTLDALFSAGLFASRHYACASRLWDIKPGTVSQKIAKNIINLFNDQYFSAKQARLAVRIINQIGRPLQ